MLRLARPFRERKIALAQDDSVSLREDVFDFAEQGAALGTIFDTARSVQFLEQFTLTLVALGRGLNVGFDKQIAFPVPVQHRNPLVLDAERSTGLRALGNFQHVIAIQSRNLDLGAQCSLRKRDRNHTAQIVAFALEERMLFDVENDVKISRGTSEIAGFSQAGIANAGTVFHAGRNFGFHCALTQHATFSFAFWTRIGDDLATSLTSGASACDAEETLLVTDLATSSASATGDGSFAGSSTRAVAVFAGFVASHSDLRLGAERGLFELQRQIFAQISATLGPCAPTTTSATKEITKTEKVSEDVAEVLEDARIEAGSAGGGADSGMSEAVVSGALVLVGKNGVGLAALLEFFFRVGIVGIAIGVILHGQLAVGTLDLSIAGRTADAQHLVVVAFSVRSQNSLPRVQFRVSSFKFRVSLPVPTRNSKPETRNSGYDFGLRATFTIAGRNRRSFNL